jgi:hypothetical protein
MSRASIYRALLLALLLAACRGADKPPPPPPPLTFDRLLNPAQMEEHHPLSEEVLAGITTESLRSLPQWQIDQLYARLDGGPIPDGDWQGSFFFADGLGPRTFVEGIENLDLVLPIDPDALSRFGETLWQGKRFSRDEALARSPVDPDSDLPELFGLALELPLLFPATLSCAESLHDPRKPSVVVDYSETHTHDGYVKEIDYLAGPSGLAIRDEMRRVRPGFYLGIAYARDQPLLVFTLTNAEAQASGQTSEREC